MAFRGYSTGRGPNYRTEYEGYSGYGAPYGEGEGSGRTYQESDRRTGRRGYYSQGPARSHLRCRDIMTRTVTTCRRNTPIAEVARMMRDEDTGAIPVLGDDGKLEGIVTDRDLVVEGLTSDKADNELRAGDCMSTDLYTAHPNDRVVEVIHEMGDHQVRRVPVVDHRSRLVGIISMADLALHTDKDQELADALEDISKPSSWLSRLANLFRWRR